MARGLRPKVSISKSCVLLIAISGMERFAFKGVASNLVTYLTDVVKMSNSSAAKTVNNWCGLTSIMPLLVAPLADSLWDRYFTILASSFFYIMGLVSVTYTAFVHNKETTSSSFLFLSLSVISIGQGAYNPALQAFAADQLGSDSDLPCNASDDQPKERTRFFTMWYFGICAGSLLGVSLMAYVQDSLGWGVGFAIPTLVMVLSIVFFSCGTSMYTTNHDQNDREDDDKPWKRTLHSIKEALCMLAGGRRDAGALESKDEPTELELQKKSLCGLDFVDTKGFTENRDRGLENAIVILRLLPIWTMLLIFAVIFQQPATFFTKQGMTMKRNFGCKLKIPPATLQSAITVSIIILMPLYDRYLVPLTRKMSGNEKGISILQRMGVGMILSTAAMIVAALVEEKRLHISKRMGISGSGQETVPMNIFWLLPQYILLGIADIFTVVGMQEFFYGEVPVKMRTMGIALYTSVFGVGSFMSAVLISMVEFFTGSHTGHEGGWFADDMSEARIDKYYWLLAFLSALSFVIYTMLCKCYTRMKE